MKFAQFFTRLVLTVLVCGLIAFANVVPAIAASSNLNAGMKQLSNIQTKADQAVKDGPYDSMDKSNRGLNEIQGTADFDKMKRGVKGEAIPAARQMEKALDKVENRINSVKDDTKNGVTSALDKVGDTANLVKEKTEDAINSLTGKAKS